MRAMKYKDIEDVNSLLQNSFEEEYSSMNIDTAHRLKYMKRGYLLEKIASLLFKDYNKVPLVEITPGIQEFQVVQENQDLIKIFVVKDDKYSLQEEKKMVKRLKELFRENITIGIEYKDKIPRKKGKLRIVYSKVDH